METASKTRPAEMTKSPRNVITTDADGLDRGKTYVSDEVVATIASIAAEQVEGVHRLGETGLRGMIGRMGRHSGVNSEVGMKQAAIDLDIVIEYGYQIATVASDLRERVIEAVQYMADREVVAVDIHVVDIYVPGQPQPRGRNLE